jgi:hypothetical protein
MLRLQYQALDLQKILENQRKKTKKKLQEPTGLKICNVDEAIMSMEYGYNKLNDLYTTLEEIILMSFDRS